MVCINCGREQSDGKFCQECGLAFPVDIREREGVQGSRPNPATQTEWTCPQCATATAEVFCPSCGIRVRPFVKEEDRLSGLGRDGMAVCPSCKTLSDKSICPQCGIRLNTGSI